MFRHLLLALCAVVAIVATTPAARATFSNYAYGVTTGTAYTMTSPTALFTGGNNTRNTLANSVAGFNLPFSFVLDGVTHTRISVSTNGLISFGSGNVTNTGSNSLTTTSSTQGQFPRIAAWWDQMYVTGGATNYCGRSPAIRYQTFGTAPSRVLVIDFRDVEVASRSVAFSSWQVRFFETSNRIEFFYGNMTSVSCRYGSLYSTSASIGIADASNDFISVTPNFSSATFSTTSVNNSNSLSTTSRRIPANTIYYFAPCNILLAGDEAQGGAAAMAAGDTLFRTSQQFRGDATSYQPFSVNYSTIGCGTRSYSMAISGPNASEYLLSTSGGSLTAGSSAVPSITFNPQSTGVRRATLTVADNNGYLRTFPLAATALSRMSLVPNIAHGGTPSLTSGDTLMRTIEIRRGTSAEFSPITITNINPNPAQSIAGVTFSIDSASGTSIQYQIVGPSSVTLGPGESVTPVIRFNAMGINAQPARLTVNADGEIRTYTLLATSMAPAITVIANGTEAAANRPIFNQSIACVGEVVTSIPFDVVNSGRLPLVVNRIDAYSTDTTFQQGTPMLPLVRDRLGRAIPLVDYVLSDAPGSIPTAAMTRVALPFTVEPGVTRRLYLTYVGVQPGKRFARAFIRTNAENVFGIDTNAYNNTTTFPVSVEGLFTVDLLARSVGSKLAADASGLRLTSLVLPNTRVGDTSFASFTIANAGACDMRIRNGQFRIASGDINDIKLIGGLRNATVDPVTGDYLLAPGVVDTVSVRFIPSRSGTRMATLRIQTNDSTILNTGVAERGSQYLDITGRGLAGLVARPLTLDPVAIGNSVQGIARLENALNIPISIAHVLFEGGDIAEFAEDAAAAWPARPFVVPAGEKLHLGVRLTPTGLAGPRTTTLLLVTTTDDTVRVPIYGEAGTQSLVVSPTSMFENVSIPSGQSFRQNLMIANGGTLPVHIASIRITGPDSASYRIGLFPRSVLDAGYTEFLEVTFAPSAPGQTSATLEVTTSTGQVHAVVLGGNALRIRRDADNDDVSQPIDNGATPVVRRGRSTPSLR